MTDEWGRVGQDGTVYVRTDTGERAVGSWLAGDRQAGLAFYRRKYDDLVAEAGLLERRLTAELAGARELGAAATRLRDSLGSAAAVGDLAALGRRLSALVEECQQRQAAAAAARAERAGRATRAKQALVEEAERLALSSQWKEAGERLRQLAEQWHGVTGVDRRTDAALWRRVGEARAELARRRTAHFAALEAQRVVVRSRKEELVAQAEALSSSSDWAATATRLRELMTQWRSAGRTTKAVDDALWQQFRAAQDAFFTARSAALTERDNEHRANLAAKEALLAAAEAIDPLAHPTGAGRELRDIEQRWAAVGKVPRAAMSGLEERMEAVRQRVRTAGEQRWQHCDPQFSRLATRLRESVAKLEARADRARAASRPAEAAELELALATQRQWLGQAEGGR